MRRVGFAGERVASKERSKPFLIILGLFGIAVFVGFALIGFEAPNAIPGRSYYYLNAEFKDADNITLHYQVRVDGDIVGQVTKTSVKDGLATVKMQIDPSVTPLRKDTTVSVLPRSAVGVRYIEITPGTRGPKLPSGSTIGASQTSATEPLDTVLDTFNQPTRANTQKFLTSLGTGFMGRGQSLNDTIGASPDFLKSATSVLNAIAAKPNGIPTFIQGGDQMAAATLPVDQTAANGFQPEANSLVPFTQSQSTIKQTLTDAPPALDTANSQLPKFDRLAAQLSGFAKAIQPGLKAAPASFNQTSALMQESLPTLVSTKTVLNTTGKAVAPFLSMLHTVQPLIQKRNGSALLQDTLAHFDPIVTSLGNHGCDIVRWGTRWTSMMSLASNGANVLRFVLISPSADESLFGITKKESDVYSNPYPAPCQAGTEKLP